MAMLPFWVKLEATVTADGTATLTYNLNPNQRWEFLSWLWKSTGSFEVTSIRSSAGENYTNVTSNNAIHSDFLPKVTNDYHALTKFPVPLQMSDNLNLNLEVTDLSSSSNLVQVLLEARYEQN